MLDGYAISLGNNDTEIRKKADSDYVSFWGEQAKKLHWFKNWDKILEWNPPFAKWFTGGLGLECRQGSGNAGR